MAFVSVLERERERERLQEMGNSKADVKVRKKSRDKKGKRTNKSWNAETIWILSPLIPFFIPLKAPLWWRHSGLTSKTSDLTPPLSSFRINSNLRSSVIPITSPYLNTFLSRQVGFVNRHPSLSSAKRPVLHRDASYVSYALTLTHLPRTWRDQLTPW